MTQRERQASGGISAVLASTSTDRTTASPAPVLNASGTDNGGSRAASWEDVYRSAAPALQQELLSLARRQGVLYAHQLPSHPRSSRVPDAAVEPGALSTLTRLLAGQITDLSPLRPATVEPVDAALDVRQRAAVARALHTPDLCLIQGLAGSGKSRVAAEVLTQAAARGERVLFVAAGTTALDRVLESVADRTAVCAFRCLERDEAAEGLSPTVRALTFAERVRRLREEAVPAAAQACAAADRRCQRRRQEEPLWPLLLDLADSWDRLQSQLAALDVSRAGLLATVQQQAAQDPPPGKGDTPLTEPFSQVLAELLGSHRQRLQQLDDTAAGLHTSQAQGREQAASLAAEVETIRPLAEARRHKRLWSPAWWKAWSRKVEPATLEDAQRRHQKALDEVAGIERQLAQAAQERSETERLFAAEQARLVEAEVARRQADLDDQEAALRHELGLLEGKWRQVCSSLDLDVRPSTQTSAAVHASQERWQAERTGDNQSAAFARDWADYLHGAIDELAAHLPDLVNVVAATSAALSADPYFGDAVAAARPFDLLVLEDADQVTDSELLRLARRACRWVLIAEPSVESPPAEPQRPKSRFPATTLSSPAALRAGCFPQLWKHLHCDPRRLASVWVQEQDRLCCRLHPVAPEQRHRLESERVADFPEIELRILNLPHSPPALAEVVFPATISIEQAKQYIYRELQELAVHPVGRSVAWLETPDGLALTLGDDGNCVGHAVLLEAGVREIVACASAQHAPAATGLWPTCRVEFDRAQGWDRERAEEWAQRHLRLRDLGRTVYLDVPHRMAPALAAVVADLVWDGAALTPTVDGAAQGLTPGVEFVAVPPADMSKARKGAPAPMRQPAALPRTGSGLELELSGPRLGDRLPAELRPALPAKGLVNYLEAQALIRRLTELIADPALQAAATRLAGVADPVVAVMALYPAQVVLIRELVRQSPKLAGSVVSIEVDHPAAFRHRQCLVALVSLTRSHSNRAVTLGEAAHFLPLALTRSRARLIVFGDPGMLVRRSQWQGELDHLDRAAATREGQLTARFVAYLQGQGPAGRAFHLCEGNGS